MERGDIERRIFDAVVFDLDGVVTRTARLHAAAWTEVFDDLLRRVGGDGSGAYRRFDPVADYLSFVDGKPRYEGVRAFLASRGIELPEGQPSDGPDRDTVHGLGANKDRLFLERLHRRGVEVYATTLALIRSLRERGVKTGVVTSSRNGREVLAAAGIEDCFDVRFDGMDAATLGIPGKPDPAPFVECAKLLGAVPGRSVVVEDAVAGVEAGRRGSFGLVVGVNRGGNREALESHGADLVVADLGELDVPTLEERFRARRCVVAWRVEQEGFDAAREHAMESLFAVGNGYLGVRGAFDAPLPGSQGDLLVAGVYDRKLPRLPYSEVELLSDAGEDPHRELVAAPFPFRLALTVDGATLAFDGGHTLEHRRILDLRAGILSMHGVYETAADVRTTVRTRRCASASDLHLLLQDAVVRLENHSGTVEVNASLVAPDLTTRFPHLRLLDVSHPAPGLEMQRFSTSVSGIEICVASRTAFGGGDEVVRWRGSVGIGEALGFRRYVAVYTSRDCADPDRAAADHVLALRWGDFERALADHEARWTEFWERADVAVPTSPATEQALRFNAYHLASAADRDPRVSVGARALTGRAYEGHVFWDSETFMLPFHLHTRPEVARSLLLYRHRTLGGARRRARKLGYRGACYAWESTVTGDDVTPHTLRIATTGKEIPIFTGTQQVHVTADVAHAVWRYFEATDDQDFVRDAGAEILVDTARFWASRCTREGERYHIRGVVGPDEYHHTVNDNAYTNWMARFNLERAVWTAEWMASRFPDAWGALSERVGLSKDEPHEWATVARRLHIPEPNADGVIEQFEGFFDLEDYALPVRERFEAPVSRLFDWERINQLKLIKQADVLMLLHLFPNAYSREIVAASYRYYEPRTDHGSSLSPGIHAAVAARIGLREDAMRYFRESLFLDLGNEMGNSALGIHPACMGATWQALVFGFLGVSFGGRGPEVDPEAGARLPEGWREVALTLLWRGRAYPLKVVSEERS